MAFFTRPQSANAAVKIVRPSATEEGEIVQTKAASPRKDSVQRQCRNIMIYGSCKFEDKGCVYYHPPGPDAVAIAPRAESPAKQIITTSLSAQAVNAPVFVPKFPGRIQTDTPPPASPPVASPESASDDPGVVYEYPAPTAVGGTQMQDISSSEYYPDPGYDSYESVGDHSYYVQPPVFVRQPLNYHLYSSAIPPGFLRTPSDTHFVPSSTELRTLLQRRSEDVHMGLPPGLNLPDEMQGYHSLVPLENLNGERRKFGNWSSAVYRAVNSVDGCTYALRRIENFRLGNPAAFSTIETWSSIRHPGVVVIHEAFTTHAFGDSSLVVSYAYHPKAQTLFDRHLKLTPPAYQPGTQFQPPPVQSQVPERTLWSYIVQLASAIKRVHDMGQALRMIDVTKVLVTGNNRIRVSSCGIVDVLMYDTPQDIQLLQQEDLTMFGRLVFVLCTGNVVASSGSNFQKSLEVMGRMYSPEVKAVALFLINKNSSHKSISQLLEIISSRVAAELGDALSATDVLENELMGELENARLVRLLCKFGFINERPEFALDPRWSETGDRYIIKLFRDFVFHQVDENGNPAVNLGHVLTCLNKLDAGSEERIMLIARDEQSCLVVSYKEILSCVEAAFKDLARAGHSINVGGGYR
ncbi:unnamed protein product [Mycena citricolor]|uniref:PAN2-PAN3 deadenylation complex subunit PAN3 n=1 Tax=Mycena citricolor TaxID=2018698 RepID=A0AAD2JXH8_9AGAR|nr:unnamed protein product [Mycena citricolor]